MAPPVTMHFWGGSHFLFGCSSHFLYNFDTLFGTEFQTQVFQFEFLDFAAARHWELLDEEDVFGNFVAGDFPLTELPDIELVHGVPFVQDDEGPYGFSVFLGRHTGHLYILDARHLVEKFFDFTRVDVFTATDNHVLDAARDAVVPVFILHSQVARMKDPLASITSAVASGFL